jgi:hypothetical protein
LFIVGLHVDDIISVTQNTVARLEFREALKTEFENITTQEGDDIEYTGKRIRKLENGVFEITMDGIINKIIGEEEKTAPTPANSNIAENDSNSPLLSEKEKESYHSLIASLLYVAKNLRGDIAFADAILACHVSKPTVNHQEKARRIVQYLNLTKNKKFFIPPTNDLNIELQVDAGFAVALDGKSQTGEILMVGGTPVLWRSVKQGLVAKDSTNAEIIAASDCIQDAMNVRELLRELNLKTNVPILKQDNQSAMFMMSEDGRVNENKYIRVRLEGIKELVRNGELEIEYLQTSDMLADMLTKPLQGAVFRSFTDQFLNTDHDRKGCAVVPLALQ